MNRPVQQPQNSQVGGSLPYRRPSSVTGQPNMVHNQSQLNGGPHFAQNQGLFTCVCKTGDGYSFHTSVGTKFPNVSF
ncbi:abl interactor 2-like [Plectropomus leopardus]|uniref:abl interactor 2-like n=1 Tax=Plectropomus leopardus TaxID=160734 RepID=UPI001C4A7771|nr:abl interactor 2-like [Plectropomus leopardus]